MLQDLSADYNLDYNAYQWKCTFHDHLFNVLLMRADLL